MEWEGKDLKGYIWIRDDRYDDYYYLKDFENLVVTKIFEPSEMWEAAVYEDEKCQKILSRQTFRTQREAQECLQQYLEITLKNRKLI